MTRLGPVQQEVKYYFLKEKMGLCLLRECVIWKAGEGRVSPAAAVEELPSDSAESEQSGDQVGSTDKACDLVGDSGTVEVVAQSSEGTPEKPVSSEPFDVPVRKEPKPQEGHPSGEPDRVSEDRVVDWGSPQILQKYGSMSDLFEWRRNVLLRVQLQWRLPQECPVQLKFQHLHLM